MKNSTSFFCNTDCEYFPCHNVTDKKNFNCMFCYCPLYHLADCPGTPSYLSNGVKDCSNCTWPHYHENAVIERLREEIKA